MTQTFINEISYGEYGKCVEISDGIVDLVVTVEVGPRIIRYGFVGKENFFVEGYQGSKGVWDSKWQVMGGHRLWHSPEGDPRSYIPDSEPVQWERVKDGIRVCQKVEPWAQIKKEIEITLDPSSNKVRVNHKLTNKNAWPVELAAWALTLVAPGGKEIVPQPHRETGLLGNRLVALWPYSKMNDQRIYWGNKYITLIQDPSVQPPFKYGIPNEDGWAAYFNYGSLFIKRYNHQLGAKYPDFGVSFETYTTDFMLEIESLSPLTLLDPEASVSHIEEWELIDNVGMPTDNEDEIDLLVKKYIIR